MKEEEKTFIIKTQPKIHRVQSAVVCGIAFVLSMIFLCFTIQTISRLSDTSNLTVNIDDTSLIIVFILVLVGFFTILVGIVSLWEYAIKNMIREENLKFPKYKKPEEELELKAIKLLSVTERKFIEQRPDDVYYKDKEIFKQKN